MSVTVNSLYRKARLARIREFDGVDGGQRASSVICVLLVLVETISMAVVIRLVIVGGGSRNDSGRKSQSGCQEAREKHLRRSVRV